MSRHKRLNIISTVANSTSGGTSETQGLHTSEIQGGTSVSQEFQSMKEQVSMANKNKKDQSLVREVNAYEKSRNLRVQENKKRLEDLGVKNIANSLTSLTESHKMKKKTEKRNTHAGDDSGADYQQHARSVVSFKQHHIRYNSPMSTDRVANSTRLRRMIGSNAFENVSLTSNAAKPTLSEGNKGGGKRRLEIVDEDDYEDDEETFQGNRVDLEAHGVDQDDELEDMGDTVHTNNQYDIEMVDHDNVQEKLQDPGIEKAAGPNLDNVSDLVTGAPKKPRGPTKKPEIWRMNSSDRILVTFDKYGKPVGDEGKELVQYLGTLVRMPEHVSIEHDDWRKVPTQQKEDMYTLVKSKFSFQPDETSEIKKWILHSMGKKWRTWKGSLKLRGYDPSLTVDEIVAQQTNKDNRVNETQFKELVSRWFTPEFQRTCARKRSSRSKMKEPHVTGTKSFARLAHEVAMKNNGVYPMRGEMYIATRTRRDGTIVDEEAAGVVASLKAIASDPTNTPGDPVDLTNDDYSKVKGPEKSGYIRMVGRMPATKNNSDSSSNSKIIHQLQHATQTINQLQNAFGVMMNIIQEHIPNANMSTLLSNMNIEIPRIGSSTSNNTLSSNELSSSRSHDDEDGVENM